MSKKNYTVYYQQHFFNIKSNKAFMTEISWNKFYGTWFFARKKDNDFLNEWNTNNILRSFAMIFENF